MKTCLLIPIFDHKDEILGVLRDLARTGLHCFVIDDGSDAETRAILDAAEKDFEWVEIFHRGENGGRGAALAAGYRLAAGRGFSHAIQLDADAQHDAADVPRFLEEVALNPSALILGTPIFDETAPRSRLYGRQISRIIVWLSTLSLDISDPLCGFRAIPLAATVELLDEVEMGNHMEFDPQLVIHLYWRQTPIRNLRTKVVYDPTGLSHFDMIQDNLRLSGVYIRALFGMLVRSPSLLARHFDRDPAS